MSKDVYFKLVIIPGVDELVTTQEVTDLVLDVDSKVVSRPSVTRYTLYGHIKDAAQLMISSDPVETSDVSREVIAVLNEARNKDKE